MKKYFFISIFLFGAYCVNAQTYTAPLLQQNSFLDKDGGKFHLPAEDLFHTPPSPQIIKSNNTVTDNMPVAGKTEQPVFVMNNKNGLDIYQSPLDKMRIAEPDKTFHSNMPVNNMGAKSYYVTVSPAAGK